MRFRRNRRSPIGIELTNASVRLMQVEWRGEEGQVVAAAEVPRQTGDVSSDANGEVRRALKQNGFAGHQAVGAIPSDEVIVRHVKVEAQDGPALHDALLFELEDAFPGDAPVIQHLEVGEVVERGERRNELILLATGLNTVNRSIEFIESCGLEPQALDAEGCALVRCFMRRRRRSSDSDVHTAIIHIGETSTLLAITGAGHPLFMKQLPVGASQMFAEIESRLDVPRSELRFASDTSDEPDELVPQILTALRLQIDSLSQELQACLRYHAATRRSPAGLEMILSGPGATIPGVETAMSKSLGAAIQRSDPFTPAYTGLTAPSDLARLRDQAARSVWNVSLGLALREVDEQ